MPFLFAATMFVSASLLFLVEPMIGKMMLPLVGGSPGVWNTCMVFFQAFLLAGYFYAHRLHMGLPARRQTVVQGIVIGLALVALAFGAVFSVRHSPFPVLTSLAPEGDQYPFFPLIVLLTIAIGLPFFVVSSCAPLLQTWFARAASTAARDPYYLYAASNAGSLLALLAYPVIVEPNLILVNQAWVWAVGFALLVLLMLACMLKVRRAEPAAEPVQNHPIADAPPTLQQSLRWLALAFVPSSLMLGLTSRVTTDLGAFPLFWIVPLALYLITFIFVFGKMQKGIPTLVIYTLPVLVLLVEFQMTTNSQVMHGVALLMHTATFFAMAMVCHGELARSRPSAYYLTHFYLMMSLGGVLGGLFNALLAPLIFSYNSEYPIALVLGCALLPQTPREDDEPWQKGLPITLAIAFGIFALSRILQVNDAEISNYLYEHGRELAAGAIVFGGVGALAAFVFGPGPDRYRFSLGIMLLTSGLLYSIVGPVVGKLAQADTLLKYFQLDPILWRWAAAVVPVIVFTKFWSKHGAPEVVPTYVMFGWAAALVCHISTLLAGGILSDALPALWGQSDDAQKAARAAIGKVLAYGFPAMLCYLFVERPVRLASAIGAMWLATFVTDVKKARDYPEDLRPHYFRSFYGQLKIVPWEYQLEIPPSRREYDDTGKEIGKPYEKKFCKALMHGTTTHGIELLAYAQLRSVAALLLPVNPISPLVSVTAVGVASQSVDLKYPGRYPASYYHRDGPVGHIVHLFREKQAAGELQGAAFGCVGLGTGTLSAYGNPGERMVFFEIDPLVRRLVEPGDYFTFLSSARYCGVDVRFQMGDARLELERHADKFGLLFVDAFSSDAIPTHLLTVQAVRIYMDHLEEHGLLAIHISNRYLDLEPVVGRIARELGLTSCIMHGGDEMNGRYPGRDRASWILLARVPKDLGSVEKSIQETQAKEDIWMKLLEDDHIRLWTDDYTPLLSVLRGEWKPWFLD